MPGTIIRHPEDHLVLAGSVVVRGPTECLRFRVEVRAGRQWIAQVRLRIICQLTIIRIRGRDGEFKGFAFIYALGANGIELWRSAGNIFDRDDHGLRIA